MTARHLKIKAKRAALSTLVAFAWAVLVIATGPTWAAERFYDWACDAQMRGLGR